MNTELMKQLSLPTLTLNDRIELPLSDFARQLRASQCKAIASMRGAKENNTKALKTIASLIEFAPSWFGRNYFEDGGAELIFNYYEKIQ